MENFNQVHSQLSNIPDELRMRNNWCISGPDKVPMYHDREGQLVRADVTNPATWMSFDYTCGLLEALPNYNAGFVLQEGEGITCIDLDVVNEQSQLAKGKPVDASQWSTQADLDRYWQIMNYFDSYTERSRSGLGLHIWVAGEIGKGCRRDGVEVYSQQRYIVCTGNVIVNKPIAHKQDILNAMVGNMRAVQQQERMLQLEETQEKESDDVIWQRASHADNDQKFKQLCEGNWQALGYPSQSEADLALMSMFTFYSDSNEQCRRMFRQTALGQRAKATRDNRYLDHTLKLIRGRQQVDKEIDENAVIIRKNIEAKLTAQNNLMLDTLQAQQQRQAQAMTTVTPSKQSTLSELSPPVQVDGCEMPWPPGFCGEIAKYFYNRSIRPVYEVAVTAALALFAGICGRAWQTPTETGLNLYIILVAQSGVGKDALHSGMSSLITHTINKYPQLAEARKFIEASDFPSATALLRHLTVTPSFVNMTGEIGLWLERLNKSSKKGDSLALDLVKEITKLYSQSDKCSFSYGKNYADQAYNFKGVQSPAYSLVGETTPSVFYDSLTEQVMANGFLSRFIIIEYTGDRPPENKQFKAYKTPSDEHILKPCSDLLNHAMELEKNGSYIDVKSDTDAHAAIEKFGLECDSNINNAKEDEGVRQLWVRAHLKVIKIASIFAVADNYLTPLINIHHVEWAINLVLQNIAMFTNRINAGDIGISDEIREKKILSVIEDFFTADKLSKSLEWAAPLKEKGIIPRSYLQQRTQRLSAFKDNTRFVFANAIKNLIENGELIVCNKDTVRKLCKNAGTCYQLNRWDKG